MLRKCLSKYVLQHLNLISKCFRGKILYQEMYDMLKNMDPPLGFGNKCPNRLAYKKLIRMNMPVDVDGKVGFTNTLFALIRENLSIKLRPGRFSCTKATLINWRFCGLFSWRNGPSRLRAARHHKNDLAAPSQEHGRSARAAKRPSEHRQTDSRKNIRRSSHFRKLAVDEVWASGAYRHSGTHNTINIRFSMTYVGELAPETGFVKSVEEMTVTKTNSHTHVAPVLAMSFCVNVSIL